MYKKLVMVVVVVVSLASVASAALEYSWDYDDGTAMGWEVKTVQAEGSQSVTSVIWHGFKDPPANTISNFGLGMNNNGSSDFLKWEIQKEITPGEQYQLSFDYRAGGEGSFIKLYFWDSNWNYLGEQHIQDYIAWGWAPSLNYNEGVWTHRESDVDAGFIDAQYVTIQLNALASWGETIFDNVTIALSPDPVLHIEPLLNGQFEVAGPGGLQAANWDMTGNCERNGTASRSGEYSIKTYDVNGGGDITWSVVSQDIVGLVIFHNTAIRLSAFAKGTDFNGLPSGSENASIKLILWRGGVVEKEEVLSFNPQSQWNFISVSTNSPSDVIIDKITVQLMYGSDNDGAGVVYWDDVALTFGGSDMAYAHNPYPADNLHFVAVADVNLYWSAGDNADAHDVYLGTVFSDVNDSARMAGDLDGDRHVGFGDLLILSNQWLGTDPLLLADIESDGGVTLADFAVLAENWDRTSYDTSYQGKQFGTIYAAGNLDYDTTYYWRIDEIDQSSGQKPVKGDVWSLKIPAKHNIVTQYWTWFLQGSGAVHWSNLYLNYGVPALGYYSSHDPYAAASHITQMLDNKVNVLSVGYVNKAGDGAMWHGLDPDQAFQNGVMKASNFGDIQFCISYDISTRAMMVHNCENGYQWGYPNGLDVLPDVQFTDPAVGSTSASPSFDFNLTDPSNGKYIYDELIEWDFKHFAETYFNQPNYFKINGQCVVTIYATERFNNGGVGGIADGFGRAWNRVRETMYDSYGHKLYLVGHFMTRGQAAADRQDYFRSAGFYQHYDAVSSWNVFDRGGSLNDLATYTAASLSAHNKFRPAALLATRNYRQWLSEPAKSAYGPSSTHVDFVPCLSYSFYDSDDSFYSSVPGDSEIIAEVQMIKEQRDLSTLAEVNATIVYQVAFNQWGEGQVLEASEPGTPVHPGKAGTMYLEVTGDILGID